MSYEKERQYYRIQFPAGDLAEFVVGPLTMQIHEVSERGIRYEPREGHDPGQDEVVEGTVILERAGQFQVVGRMSRRQGDTIVVVLDPPGLPYSALMQEQLYLRKRYPTRDG
jgi:hypothetical protein